jgi:hypothetical protein
LFAENSTGKVAHIENASSLGYIVKYVYLDSNDDKIIDSIIYFASSGSGSILDLSTVFVAYIKVGSSIVFDYNRENVQHGIFYDGSGIGESIVSIDGITKSRLFIP